VGKTCRRAWQPLCFAFLVALGGDAITSNAKACSCRQPIAKNILASSAVVFTGSVRKTKPVAANVHATTFVVTENFKGGRRGAVLTIRHRSGPSASCGVRFVLGRSYTVRATGRSKGGLTTSLCSVWSFLPHVRGSQRLISKLRNAKR